MHIIRKIINKRSMNLVFIRAGLLTSCGSDTGHRGSDTRPCTPQIKPIVIDLIEKMLRVICRRANKHYVARLAMERHQAGTPFLPTVSELSQNVSAIVIARGGLHSQRMKFSRLGDLLTDL